MKNIQQSQNAKRKNLAEWRASRLHDMELPSGLPVTLRDCDLTDLIFTGQLPQSILEIGEEALAAGNTEIDLKKIGLGMIKENAAEFKVMLDAIVVAALVEPKLGEVADDEHITLAELSNSDKMEIMNWITREVPQLKSFREKQDQPLAFVQHGDSLRAEAESVSQPGD